MRLRSWIGWVVAAIWVAILIYVPGKFDKGVWSAVGQAVGTLAAVGIALHISANDRRDARLDAGARDAAEREAFIRRRDYDECLRLMALIERDRQAWESEPHGVPPRSIEATALIRALWGRRNWWGTAVDWYIESRKPGWRFHDPATIPEDIFARMQSEIVDAIMKLDFQDRRPPDLDEQAPRTMRRVIDGMRTGLAGWITPGSRTA